MDMSFDVLSQRAHVIDPSTLPQIDGRHTKFDQDQEVENVTLSPSASKITKEKSRLRVLLNAPSQASITL